MYRPVASLVAVPRKVPAVSYAATTLEPRATRVSADWTVPVIVPVPASAADAKIEVSPKASQACLNILVRRDLSVTWLCLCYPGGFDRRDLRSYLGVECKGLH